MKQLVIILAATIFPATIFAAPEAWIKFNQPDAQQYKDTPYHFLGDAPICLEIDLTSGEGQVLDLLWGSKNDQRGALLKVNGKEQLVTAGGYEGFQWNRVPVTVAKGDKEFLVELHAPGGRTKAGFLAAVRVTSADSPLNEKLPEASSKLISLVEPPLSDLDKWAKELLDESLTIERRALVHGMQASEALRRCREYIDGWHAHCDPKTGLVPRNLNKDKYIWNGKDSAADNYAFMVLTAALTDRPLYKGRMLDILHTEQRVATRNGGLPADYNFQKQGFNNKEDKLSTLIFHGSEYVKDGLMPITEWMGDTPWSDRMIGIIDSILEQAEFETPYGKIPSGNIEVNGEMMQVLSRIYFRYDKEEYLDMACRIADYYLLGEHHPTRNSTELHLRDHNCELISGLTEVYGACHFARKEKAELYKEPIYKMLDDILRSGVNEYGLMYQTVNPQDGKILNKTIHDNWGYNYNGFYTVYLLDGVEKYREACRFAMSNLKEHYWKFQWQGWSSDGIADSVEGAINLFNREPDVKGVPEWIDANINRMLDIQKPDGVIEGWHGDGNYARTAIMWALWKQQGTTIQPWREDIKIGAVLDGNKLYLVLKAEKPWQGKIVFDQPRHKTFMKMPLDYPRINQFPEWFTIESGNEYKVSSEDGSVLHKGSEMIAGLPVELKDGGPRLLVVSDVMSKAAFSRN